MGLKFKALEKKRKGKEKYFYTMQESWPKVGWTSERGGKPGTGEADISNEGTWTVAGLGERKRFA